MSFLTLSGVSCATPENRILFSGLDLAVGREVVGLVGRNGSGKSTLIAAIAGDAPVAAGTISRPVRFGLLRQTLPAGVSVAQALEAADELDRLARIEAGEPGPDDLDRADWTLPARLDAALAAADLPGIDLDRPADTLSGGERTRLMLAAMLLPEPKLLLLDEPTNNLDAAGRAALHRLLDGWGGGVLIASHDRALLRRADRIVELAETGINVVGGGWDAFERVRTAERERAASELERSERALDAAQRGAQREREKQDRRDKRGRATAASRSDPRILLGAKKRQAEASAARYDRLGDELAGRAMQAAEAARAQVERVTPIRIALPPTGLSSSHVLVEARGLACHCGERTLFDGIDLTIRGPERIVLEGPNGSGKTSLIRMLTGDVPPAGGTLSADHKRIALFDQHLAMLRAGETLAEAVARHNPPLDRNAVHTALAAYGFRNMWAGRTVGSLSGGERVRLALVCLFSGETPPQMLVLDEPTNHLDIAATELLEQALAGWDGALLLVSHDADFVRAVDPQRRILLG